MSVWGMMRLLVHRGQVLLLVVVGVLVGITFCCVVLELMGVPVLEPLGVDELFVRHTPELPARIVIDSDGGAESTPAPATVVHDRPVASPTATLVPPVVYSYPPEGGGGDRGGGGSDGRHG